MKKLISLVVAAVMVAVSLVPAPVTQAQALAIPQSRQAFVQFLYNCTLQRAAETGGFNSWVGVSQSGYVSPEQMYYGFFNSPEYQSRLIPDVQFVSELYNCVLFRSPDNNGLAAWLNALSMGYSRQHVLDGFLYSWEFQNMIRPHLTPLLSGVDPELPQTQEQFVKHLYACVLERQGESSGIQAWMNVLSQSSPTELYYGFFNSPEYQSRGVNNNAFVVQAYRCILFRTPAASEAAVWQNLLNHGMASRSEVLNGFLYSPEFQQQILPQLSRLSNGVKAAHSDNSVTARTAEEEPVLVEYQPAGTYDISRPGYTETDYSYPSAHDSFEAYEADGGFRTIYR
jgi:hypothetical protein